MTLNKMQTSVLIPCSREAYTKHQVVHMNISIAMLSSSANGHHFNIFSQLFFSGFWTS